MNKEISSKNTKNEILEAYEEALRDIKQLNTKTKQQTLALNALRFRLKFEKSEANSELFNAVFFKF